MLERYFLLGLLGKSIVENSNHPSYKSQFSHSPIYAIESTVSIVKYTIRKGSCRKRHLAVYIILLCW